MNSTSAVEVRIQALFPALKAAVSWAKAGGPPKRKIVTSSNLNIIRDGCIDIQPSPIPPRPVK